MTQNSRSTLLLHFVIFLWGFTGIIGKLIDAETLVLVIYRMGLSYLALKLYLVFYKKAKPPRKTQFQLVGVGAIIAIHWLCFFQAIKLSNVSVALVCLSFASVFVAFLEPIVFKRKISFREIFLGVVAVVGISLIFNFQPQHINGIILGILSAFFGAVFTVFNGKIVQTTAPSQMGAYQMLGGFLLLLLIAPFYPGSNGIESFIISAEDWFWLVVLSIICTAFAFVASMRVMKYVSPFTLTLTVNLEPIYSIILAFIIFKEYQNLSWGFYVGTLILLSTVFIQSSFKSFEKRKQRKLANTATT